MLYAAWRGGSYQPVVCDSSIVSALSTSVVAAGQASSAAPRCCATVTACGCISSASCRGAGAAVCSGPAVQPFWRSSQPTEYVACFPQPETLTLYSARCGGSYQPVPC